ncbi:Endoribonuclease Dicer-like [Giardia muris]|uniref:Endoribonuclease Dicer-like n=1 Tax=Giardia muris TaxID=5742 RepID=A0A4Z1STC2_GIAMU|nr:Endoribonuclease Dicer-like [Giardia muris]|eukprot:TNJ29144.1 Endoribonuclease Dicer-like [Giardia muris]
MFEYVVSVDLPVGHVDVPVLCSVDLGAPDEVPAFSLVSGPVDAHLRFISKEYMEKDDDEISLLTPSQDLAIRMSYVRPGALLDDGILTWNALLIGRGERSLPFHHFLSNEFPLPDILFRLNNAPDKLVAKVRMALNVDEKASVTLTFNDLGNIRTLPYYQLLNRLPQSLWKEEIKCAGLLAQTAFFSGSELTRSVPSALLESTALSLFSTKDEVGSIAKYYFHLQMLLGPVCILYRYLNDDAFESIVKGLQGALKTYTDWEVSPDLQAAIIHFFENCKTQHVYCGRTHGCYQLIGVDFSQSLHSPIPGQDLTFEALYFDLGQRIHLKQMPLAAVVPLGLSNYEPICPEIQTPITGLSLLRGVIKAIERFRLMKKKIYIRFLPLEDLIMDTSLQTLTSYKCELQLRLVLPSIAKHIIDVVETGAIYDLFFESPETRESLVKTLDLAPLDSTVYISPDLMPFSRPLYGHQKGPSEPDEPPSLSAKYFRMIHLFVIGIQSTNLVADGRVLESLCTLDSFSRQIAPSGPDLRLPDGCPEALIEHASKPNFFTQLSLGSFEVKGSTVYLQYVALGNALLSYIIVSGLLSLFPNSTHGEVVVIKDSLVSGDILDRILFTWDLQRFVPEVHPLKRRNMDKKKPESSSIYKDTDSYLLNFSRYDGKDKYEQHQRMYSFLYAYLAFVAEGPGGLFSAERLIATLIFSERFAIDFDSRRVCISFQLDKKLSQILDGLSPQELASYCDIGRKSRYNVPQLESNASQSDDVMKLRERADAMRGYWLSAASFNIRSKKKNTQVEGAKRMINDEIDVPIPMAHLAYRSEYSRLLYGDCTTETVTGTKLGNQMAFIKAKFTNSFIFEKAETLYRELRLPTSCSNRSSNLLKHILEHIPTKQLREKLEVIGDAFLRWATLVYLMRDQAMMQHTNIELLHFLVTYSVSNQNLLLIFRKHFPIACQLLKDVHRNLMKENKALADTMESIIGAILVTEGEAVTYDFIVERILHNTPLESPQKILGKEPGILYLNLLLNITADITLGALELVTVPNEEDGWTSTILFYRVENHTIEHTVTLLNCSGSSRMEVERMALQQAEALIFTTLDYLRTHDGHISKAGIHRLLLSL